MFFAPVDIHGCILFNFIVIIKIATNDSRLWSCVCCYQFMTMCDKRSLQSNHICKLVNFTVCAICCNLDSQITPSTEDFKGSTNWNCLYHGVEDKLIVNHHSFGS